MTAAPVESCQAMVQRSPRGRFWSVVDVRKRPHRTCGGFHRCIHISKVLCTTYLPNDLRNRRTKLWTMIGQRFRSRGLWGAPSAGACGVGDARL